MDGHPDVRIPGREPAWHAAHACCALETDFPVALGGPGTLHSQREEVAPVIKREPFLLHDSVWTGSFRGLKITELLFILKYYFSARCDGAQL